MLDDFSNGIPDEIVEFLELGMQDSLVVAADKTKITDKAIRQIPFIKFSGISHEACERIQRLEKMLLVISRERNNSNEVAITSHMDEKGYPDCGEALGIAYGNENSVNILNDKNSRLLFEKSSNLAVICMHNHPNNSSFSLNDLVFFLNHDQIRLFIVVGNNGEIRSISRDDLILKTEARNRLINMIYKKIPDIKEQGIAVIDTTYAKRNLPIIIKKWLKIAEEEYGLSYKEGVLRSGQKRAKPKSKVRQSRGR